MIAERLTELTSKRGGQAALSKAIGVSSGLVSAWCAGSKEPRAGNVAKIAAHFGVSADYLLGLSNESVPSAPEKEESPPSFGISENGKIMLAYFEDLPNDIQHELIGEAKAYYRMEEKKKISNAKVG